jgi:predicted negative regulator of RcsB-dependent stress response
MPMSDQEQIQIAKKWWKEYGPYLIFTVIFFLVASYGWNFWNKRDYRIKENASLIYTQLVTAYDQKRVQDVEVFAKQLMDDYSRTPYASFAALFLAKNSVEKNDLESAFSSLEFIINKAPDKTIRQLAKIRAARVLVAMREPSKALDLLENPSNDSYKAERSEALGDALFALGKNEEAKQAYLEAQKITKEQNRELPLIKTKLQRF